jgi:predicted metal-dependent peptidase
MSVKEKITKIVEKWYLTEPLFFAVWTLHKIIPEERINTIRVRNGCVEYNTTFLDSLNPSDLEAVLGFEAMRIILKHPYSRKKELTEISYLASNITIQEYLETKDLGFLSAKEFFASDDFNKKHFEFYYDKILERAQNSSQETSENDPDTESQSMGNSDNGETNEDKSDKDENGEDDSDKSSSSKDKENDENGDQSTNKTDGSSEKGNDNEKSDEVNNDEGASDEKSSSSDESNNTDAKNTLEHYTNEKSTGFENACNWGRNEYHEQLVNEKIKDVSIANAWGTISQNLQEIILATLKPKINYKMILKSFRSSILSNTRRLTRMKPSRRYGFLYMGSRRDFTTKLLLAVDISGSVSSAALKNAFSILNRFFKYGIEEITVICFDTEIKGSPLTLKKAKKEIVISGRGGTSFSAVTNYIDKNRSYDGVIIFTDGYAPCPDPPKNKKTKVLWLFDTESNYRLCKSNLSKIGKVAFVKDT